MMSIIYLYTRCQKFLNSTIFYVFKEIKKSLLFSKTIKKFILLLFKITVFYWIYLKMTFIPVISKIHF